MSARAILRILHNMDPEALYGLEIVKAADGEIQRGTVYVTLQDLEDSGFVRSREETETEECIGIPRRLYKITSAGEFELLRISKE